MTPSLALFRQQLSQARIAPLERCPRCLRLLAFHVDRTGQRIGCAGARRDQQLCQALAAESDHAHGPAQLVHRDDNGLHLVRAGA